MGVTVYLDPAGENVELDVAEDADWGRVNAELTTARRGPYGVERVVQVHRNERRQMSLPVVIRGEGEGDEDTSDADWAVEKLATITRLCAAGCTMYLQDTGQTRGVYVRVLPSPGPVVPTDRLLGIRALLRPTLELFCEPYAYASEETLVNGAATSVPALVSLAAQTGEFHTPLVWTLALANMTQVFLGLLEEQYTWSGWLLDANDLPWSGGGNAVDGNAAGGYARKLSSGGTMSVAIPVTAFPQGEYAMLVRTRMTSGAATVYDSHIGSDEDVAKTVDWTAYKWANLGRIVCPTRRTYGSGTASTTLTVEADTGDTWVDRIAFVRTSAGYAEYDGAAMDSFASDGEHLYVDGRVNYRYCKGGALYALRGQLQAIVEVAGSPASFSPVVTLKAEPRHNLWR